MYMEFFNITAEKSFLLKAKSLIEQAVEDFTYNGLIYFDRAGKTLETFDESVPSAVGIIADLIENHSDKLLLSLSNEMENFLADRAVKYPTAHGTVLGALKFNS